jgi:hypothetical protein
MATWKKVIVSGSNASLNQVNVGTNQQITTSPSTTYLSGSFSGSFAGDGSQLTGVVATAAYALSQSTGITAFSYNGISSATVAVSGASSLSSNAITKWTGNAFANSSLTDNGTTITGATSIQLTGASSNLSGSFSGSFYGSGAGLTGLATTLYTTGSYNGGITTGSINLTSQALTIAGTLNEVDVVATNQTITIGLPNDVTIGGNLTLGGNTIKSSGGSTVITLSGTDTTLAGDLQVNGNDIKSSAGNSVFTLSGTNATANGNLTVNGDLTVAGTASFQNQTSLLVSDRFVLLASGSTTLTDGGIIINSGTGLSGSAWYLESTSTGASGRWAVASNVDAGASTVTADEYGVTAKLSTSSSPSDSVPPTYGGSTNGKGNIWIKEDTGDIYIWA